jgi:hypothetical protein
MSLSQLKWAVDIGYSMVYRERPGKVVSRGEKASTSLTENSLEHQKKRFDFFFSIRRNFLQPVGNSGVSLCMLQDLSFSLCTRLKGYESGHRGQWHQSDIELPTKK